MAPPKSTWKMKESPPTKVRNNSSFVKTFQFSIELFLLDLHFSSSRLLDSRDSWITRYIKGALKRPFGIVISQVISDFLRVLLGDA